MISDVTHEVLELLSKEPFFKENEVFLIGGTAVAYHTKHRTSYDLDFSILNSNEFPDLSFLKKHGAEKMNFNNFTKDSVENEGGDIEELHQRFLIKGIKVEFFCPFGNSEKEILKKSNTDHRLNNIQIASLDALFMLKTLTLFDRNKIRDLYDVVYLMKKHNYTAQDVVETIQKYKYENLFNPSDTIKLMETILSKREVNQDDLDFEGVHNEAMEYIDYDDLKNHLRAKILAYDAYENNAYYISKELQKEITTSIQNGDIKIDSVGEISKDNPNCVVKDYEVLIRDSFIIPKEEMKIITRKGDILAKKMSNFEIFDKDIVQTKAKEATILEAVEKKKTKEKINNSKRPN